MLDFLSETRSRPRPPLNSPRPRRYKNRSRDRLETETTSLVHAKNVVDEFSWHFFWIGKEALGQETVGEILEMICILLPAIFLILCAIGLQKIRRISLICCYLLHIGSISRVMVWFLRVPSNLIGLLLWSCFNWFLVASKTVTSLYCWNTV